MVETVQKTVESPQLVLLLDKVVDVPVLATSWGCRGSVRSCSSSTGVSAHHGYDELMRRLFRAVSVAILAQVRRLSLGIFGGLGGVVVSHLLGANGSRFVWSGNLCACFGMSPVGDIFSVGEFQFVPSQVACPQCEDFGYPPENAWAYPVVPVCAVMAVLPWS